MGEGDKWKKMFFISSPAVQHGVQVACFSTLLGNLVAGFCYCHASHVTQVVSAMPSSYLQVQCISANAAQLFQEDLAQAQEPMVGRQGINQLYLWPGVPFLQQSQSSLNSKIPWCPWASLSQNLLLCRIHSVNSF